MWPTMWIPGNYSSNQGWNCQCEDMAEFGGFFLMLFAKYFFVIFFNMKNISTKFNKSLQWTPKILVPLTEGCYLPPPKIMKIDFIWGRQSTGSQWKWNEKPAEVGFKSCELFRFLDVCSFAVLQFWSQVPSKGRGVQRTSVKDGWKARKANWAKHLFNIPNFSFPRHKNIWNAFCLNFNKGCKLA